MPGKMKPSQKFSIVPEGMTERFREMRRGEDAPKMAPSAPQGGPSMSDRDVLKRMIEDEKMDMMEDREEYAKGGMVRKKSSGRGMIKVRGYGKARSKPCKIC
jgi:phage tail sheath gpL-like